MDQNAAKGNDHRRTGPGQLDLSLANLSLANLSLTNLSLVDLSHPIVTGMPQWPGDAQALRIVRLRDHGDGGLRSSRLELGCHVGTHVDAPGHFLAGAPGVDGLTPERFCGAAMVVRPPRTAGAAVAPGPLGADALDGVDLAGVDFVLFDTGWARHWGQPAYYADWPWLSAPLAAELAAAGLKGVGLDTPSIDDRTGRRAHDLFAAAGMVNLENLAHLDRLPPRGFLLVALPLPLAGAEASPVRAVALLERERLPGAGGSGDCLDGQVA
ncbi:cyclase family protein [bacterium]|nr:cyclase family protein [bacterium]